MIKLKAISILVLCFIWFSCSKNIYDNDYKGENNYESFYVVDTIKISDPVCITSSKYGGTFVVSKAILRDFNNDITFFSRPDVFLFGDQFYRDLPLKNFKKYKYPDFGGCDFLQSRQKTEELIVSEFQNKPRYFILCLINANYFYRKHMAFDAKTFIYPDKNNKITFYKIVYPLCER